MFIVPKIVLGYRKRRTRRRSTVNGEQGAYFGASNNADEDSNYNMLTDMTPSAGQFYGSQIPSMGMSHIQKPTVSVSAVSNLQQTIVVEHISIV